MGPGSTVLGFCWGVDGCGHTDMPRAWSSLPRAVEGACPGVTLTGWVLQTDLLIASNSSCLQPCHCVDHGFIIFLLIHFSSVPSSNVSEMCEGSHLCEHPHGCHTDANSSPSTQHSTCQLPLPHLKELSWRPPSPHDVAGGQEGSRAV